MAFHSIAYGDGDLCLLTIDANELLAYDAQSESPRWRLSFSQPLVGVLFVDPAAFPARQGGGNPFRSQSSARVALVVDQESRLHLVDTTLGQNIGEVDPPSGPQKPYAIATSSSGAVALAIEDTLHLWRSGERTQLPGIRTRAVAFSNDGKTLAVGTDKGELRMYFVSPDTKAVLDETYKTKVSEIVGSISDLDQHPSGDWVVVGSNGAARINAAGPSRIEKIPENILRVRFDGNGKRLAVQRSERGIVVYEWPGMNVMMRVEYTDRPVRGLSFGPDNWIGVALNHGDGNKIDVVTSAVHRTDTHPGRQHRSWTLMVEGKKEILSAKEAEDIRRMKSSFEEVKPATTSGMGAGGRIGIGAMISIALIAVRVCVRASSPSPSYSNFNFPTTMPFPKSCDKSCALERIQSLKRECAAVGPNCVLDAEAAEKAINEGKCAEAKAAIERIPVAAGENAQGASSAPLFSSTRLLASLGVNEACSGAGLRPSLPTTTKRMNLTHVKTAGLPGGKDAKPTESTERIFEDTTGDYETAEGMYVAPDGTMFVVGKTKTDRIVVHRRAASGTSVGDASKAAWETVYTKQSGRNHSFIFGRSAKDVWVSDSVALVHYDGQNWTGVSTPVASIHRMVGNATDTFMLGGGFSSTGTPINLDLYKRKGPSWTTESTAPFRSMENVFANPAGNSVFAFAFDPETSHDVLLQRAGSGTWQARKLPAVPTPSGDAGAGAADEDETDAEPEFRSAWVSPSGDAFVTTNQSLVLKVSAGGAVTRTITDGTISAIWGRSSTDVYGVSFGSLQHFDGKKWSSILDLVGTTPDIISGNANEVLLLANTEY